MAIDWIMGRGLVGHYDGAPATRLGAAVQVWKISAALPSCPDDLATVLALQGHNPVHIHIVEQPREVKDVQAWMGARPVEWRLQNAPANDSA